MSSPYGYADTLDGFQEGSVKPAGKLIVDVNLKSYVLAAIDVNLGAIHVGASLGAQHVDDFGHLVWRAGPVQGDVRDDGLGAGREDGGIDLARRDRIDTDPERTEVGRHLAGQCRKRGLRSAVGGAGERMHPRAGNRGDVDHRTLRGLR